MTELILKDIRGYEGHYQIGSDGEVYSMKRRNLTKIGKTADQDGYKIVRLFMNAKPKFFYNHRLVAEHFIGVPDGMNVNHIDGNKENNSLQNLEVTTPRENVNHYWRASGSSLAGVTKTKSGKYQSKIKVNGVVEYLGLFETPEGAHQAYVAKLPDKDKRYLEKTK